MTYRVGLAAATWMQFTAATLAANGIRGHFTIKGETAIQIGRKATAPTAGVAVAANDAAEIIFKQGDTMTPWVYSAAATILVFEQVGGKTVIIDGTGTT